MRRKRMYRTLGEKKLETSPDLRFKSMQFISSTVNGISLIKTGCKAGLVLWLYLLDLQQRRFGQLVDPA